ncbi:transmembrane and ubiquitin-like domain-containing protein 1 isoform X2 [Cylas formicarius]|uniref:transmembrane and ubiquitin-like domain-containing protein 1 isoform X2 n=1 Tax=Cylas formicarius TaxID=197179 RepID=UPI0029587991|nr:transmembrane and ubiquitin-like domain-containing protein 1 isoform X2 [Cylas formicarius]
MTLIDGIGDEVTYFFVAIFSLIVVSIAWWSTNIRQFRTVVLLDRRRRTPITHRLVRHLSNHIETTSISAGTSSISVEAESNITANNENSSITSVSTSSATQAMAKPNEEDTITTNTQESEEQNIIETMDAGQNGIRFRFRTNCAGQNQEQGDQNYEETAEIPSASSSDNDTNKSYENQAQVTIKLMFINDDVKTVKGNLSESLGDFRRKHFRVELESNKIVRLIFNGQILKHDTQTLQSYGFFENCVVHCLIHQKRSQENQDTSRSSSNIQNTEYFGERTFEVLTNSNNNNQGIDWDLGNFLFAVISFILLAAWYFRYVYAHLYTVTATVGLILITGIFTVVLVGMYFPDTEHVSLPTIRIARSERIELQHAN